MRCKNCRQYVINSELCQHRQCSLCCPHRDPKDPFIEWETARLAKATHPEKGLTKPPKGNEIVPADQQAGQPEGWNDVTTETKTTKAQDRDARGDRARKLLALDLPLREVLRVCGVRQEPIAKAAKIGTPRVSRILGSLREAKKQGYATSDAVFRAAAKLLGIDAADIPEYRELQNVQKREQELKALTS